MTSILRAPGVLSAVTIDHQLQGWQHSDRSRPGWPGGICLSSTGDLYIADEFNHQIRVVPTANTTEWDGVSMSAAHIYAVVGSTAGDGGTAANGTAATSALLNSLTSVTCAASTDLYIADQGNSEIQEVPTTAASA